MVASATRRLFSVAEYQRMAEVGILNEDDRVELIEGEIVAMSPIGPVHYWCVNRLVQMVVLMVGRSAVVSIQSPIRLVGASEPQPDLVVVRDGADQRAIPRPSDVLLVLEVCDSSLAYDRGVKLPLYAAAAIPEAWLVDLSGEMIELHTDPRGGIYRQTTIARRGETLPSTTVAALSFDVDAVLG